MTLRHRFTLWLCLVVLGISLTALPVLARPHTTSMDENGVDAIRLHNLPYDLRGRKIAIGQVEIGRPGVFGFDKTMSWNPPFEPAQVFVRDQPATPNREVDAHATMVASVMISRDKGLPGVAPDALLFASAAGAPRGNGQPQECLASQFVALQNGGDVRAINFSFGEPISRDPRPDARLDGNALLTRCVDWSARVHNTLYTIAGNQGQGGIQIPTDNFNGINVASTRRRDGIFSKLDFSNLSAAPTGVGRTLIRQEINFGPRRSIAIVAPGQDISVFDLRGRLERVTGTSFATPHVNATVALLQEFGDRQIRQRQWAGTASRQAEVMKAVILNSADKVQDQGDGKRLGMSRNIYTMDEKTWLESDAYRDPQIPFDFQMGTGQLNVWRAYQQFSPGQAPANRPAPAIAWDYGKIQANEFQEYPLQQPLEQDSFASITLAWHRRVELVDNNGNQQFDIGEGFRDQGLNNLDLYLMPANATDPSQSICASISGVDSTEHIFCPIPRSGQYKIRVVFKEQVNEAVQNYGLAWWTKPAS